MMLSDRPFYGAGCLAPAAGDLVSRLSPQAKADHRPWVPLSPAGKTQWQGNGCCWRRAPLKSAEDSGQPVQLPGCHLRERFETDGNMDAKRPMGLSGLVLRPTVEPEERHCRGFGHTMEAEVRLFAKSGPKVEGMDGPGPPTDCTPDACVGSYHGTGPTAEAGSGLNHGAGPTEEAGSGLYHGAGPTAEAGGGLCDRVGHRVEEQCRPYHGADHKQVGISQDHTISASKDCAVKELTESHKHQWRYQNIKDVEGNVTTGTGPSDIHPHPAWEGTAGLADPVTMETGAVGGQAQLGDATQAEENVDDVDCEELKEAEDHDDEFGVFEKAGNLVQWAEFPGPLGLESETPHEQSYAATGWSWESGEDVATCRMWRPRSENMATEPDMDESAHPGASLHGSSNRAAESWRSTCPPSCFAPDHTPTSESGWRAFHNEDRQMQGSGFDAFPLNKWEIEQQGTRIKWWSTALERHTFQPTPSAQTSLGNVGLESVFHSCFPMVSSTSSHDSIPPLGQLLGTEKPGEGFLSTQACDLWASLQSAAETVGLRHKWTEYQSRKHLLTSLCVDPATTETSTGSRRTTGSSPLFSIETRMELQPSPEILDWDYKELTLIKNPTPQIQNGFSPTHRIQAFFYQWTQSDRNGKSKTTYDFNKNFMA